MTRSQNIAAIALGIWGLTAWLACEVCTTPEVADPTILAEWDIAQNALAAAGVPPGRAFSIGPEVFHWRVAKAPFTCDGQLSNGCYQAAHLRITYNREVPQVIRHEAGHAILHVLGYRCWQQWQHDGGKCP